MKRRELFPMITGLAGADWHLEQVVSRMEALRMFTQAPAFATFSEGERGTIEGVLHADDVVAFQPIAGEGLKRRWRTWDTSTTRPWWDGASQRDSSTVVELSPGSPRPL